MSSDLNSHRDDNAGAVPKFVEPDYGVDASTPTIKEAEPDSCCARCGSECRYPGWFSIQEGERILDIPASFGPTSLQARLVKFVFMVWFNASVIYKWWTKRDHPAFFLAWLTNWSLIFSCIYLIMSFLNSILPPAQPKTQYESVSLWTKITWLLFEVASHFVMITVLLYWSLQYEPGVSGMDYVNIFTHAITLLVWFEGLYINRIPVRWKHLPVPMLLAALYVIWLAIHQLATDIGNPPQSDNDPETDDDLMYPSVNFTETPLFSSILVVLVVFAAVPLIHWLLWTLSLYSFPCNCSGYNRRYISEVSTVGSGKENANNNVNMYEDNA